MIWNMNLRTSWRNRKRRHHLPTSCRRHCAAIWRSENGMNVAIAHPKVDWLSPLPKKGAVSATSPRTTTSITLATVKTYDDQDITLFDAVVAVVSGKLQIPVWTFDSDFDVMRSNVWRD